MPAVEPEEEDRARLRLKQGCLTTTEGEPSRLPRRVGDLELHVAAARNGPAADEFDAPIGEVDTDDELIASPSRCLCGRQRYQRRHSECPGERHDRSHPFHMRHLHNKY